MSSLPHTYTVSRPRQPTNAGESMLRRQDATPRPYWLRDWQPDFGGFTKVYEYKKGDEVKRVYLVAYITRPRTKEANACLCFTLVSGMPKKKPWKRDPDVREPSRTVVLDLQENSEWQMDSTVKITLLDPAKPLDDDMQVQCLPVYKAEAPQWTYRKVPKLASLSEATTACLSIEDITESLLVSQLSDAERHLD